MKTPASNPFCCGSGTRNGDGDKNHVEGRRGRAGGREGSYRGRKEGSFGKEETLEGKERIKETYRGRKEGKVYDRIRGRLFQGRLGSASTRKDMKREKDDMYSRKGRWERGWSYEKYKLVRGKVKKRCRKER